MYPVGGWRPTGCIQSFRFVEAAARSSGQKIIDACRRLLPLEVILGGGHVQLLGDT